MVSIMALIIVFTTFLFTASICDAVSKDVDNGSLNEHVKNMDALFQELKSHSQAQEQKYSAVSSSVLSQLTQTTEELSRSKNVSEELQEEVERMKEELQSLREENNRTTEEFRNLKETYNHSIQEMAQLKEIHNESLFELEMVKNEVLSLQGDWQSCNHSLSKLDSTMFELNSTQTEIRASLTAFVGQMNATGNLQLTGSETPWSKRDIGFEVSLNRTKLFLASSTIVFDEIQHNKGNGYNTSTGYFTAPVSGTYLFWTNIVFKSQNDTTFLFPIQTGKIIHGEAYGRTNENYGTASATTSFYLKKGEQTSIHCNMDVELQGKVSSAGALLI